MLAKAVVETINGGKQGYVEGLRLAAAVSKKKKINSCY